MPVPSVDPTVGSGSAAFVDTLTGIYSSAALCLMIDLGHRLDLFAFEPGPGDVGR